ncbi:hypothetical protein ccbrp13_56420 [Ktedonobacteria bacterium brp13]|nr:hypothetical protein ccbrp13_56420 [Ktedonobacteria bacterium brp13]
MEEITIKQVKQPMGFGKPVETPLQGFVFENGKIAYLNANEEVCAATDEKALVKDLKVGNCIEVHVIHKA